MGGATCPHVALGEIRPQARMLHVLHERTHLWTVSTLENAHDSRMDPIATTVNDLGEPDAGKPPVRFDEGRFNKPSTLSRFSSGTIFFVRQPPAQKPGAFLYFLCAYSFVAGA